MVDIIQNKSQKKSEREILISGIRELLKDSNKVKVLELSKSVWKRHHKETLAPFYGNAKLGTSNDKLLEFFKKLTELKGLPAEEEYEVHTVPKPVPDFITDDEYVKFLDTHQALGKKGEPLSELSKKTYLNGFRRLAGVLNKGDKTKLDRNILKDPDHLYFELKRSEINPDALKASWFAVSVLDKELFKTKPYQDVQTKVMNAFKEKYSIPLTKESKIAYDKAEKSESSPNMTRKDLFDHCVRKILLLAFRNNESRLIKVRNYDENKDNYYDMTKKEFVLNDTKGKKKRIVNATDDIDKCVHTLDGLNGKTNFLFHNIKGDVFSTSHWSHMISQIMGMCSNQIRKAGTQKDLKPEDKKVLEHFKKNAQQQGHSMDTAVEYYIS